GRIRHERRRRPAALRLHRQRRDGRTRGACGRAAHGAGVLLEPRRGWRQRQPAGAHRAEIAARHAHFAGFSVAVGRRHAAGGAAWPGQPAEQGGSGYRTGGAQPSRSELEIDQRREHGRGGREPDAVPADVSGQHARGRRGQRIVRQHSGHAEVAAMRIASTQYHATMNTALQKANERLSDILQKMASGEKFSLPSEDPVGAVRLSRLTREEAALVQYRENIATLKGRLSQNEAFLDGMISDMTSARDLLVWALDGSNTAADINAMASSIQPIIDSLFYAANSRDAEGRYLFSGTLSDTAALTYDPAAALGARYTYTGNAGRQLVAVAAGVQQAANVTVQEMAAMLNQLDQVRAVLSAPGVSANDPVVRAELQAALNVTDQTLNVTA